MTVVKIIQHDFNQQLTEAKASSNITIGNDENVWEKPKSKHQSKSPPILIQDDARPETSNRYQVFDPDLNPSAGSVRGTLASVLIPENQDQDRSNVDKLRQPVSPSKKSSGKAKEHNPGDNSSKQSSNRIDVAIFGDSMLKFINPSKLRKS